MLIVDIYKDYGNFKLSAKYQTDDKMMGLLGASGSGKSLTLKSIAGIETPDEGIIVLNGRVLFDSEKGINLRPQERKVGYLFQDYALFPNMNVFDNIKSGVRSDRNADEIVRRKIGEMELNGLEYKKPIHLSGGEKQRVALARILVNEPEILLLDEPFSALDQYVKWKIEYEIKEVIRKYDIPSVFVSHNRDEVYRICDSIVVMNEGKTEERQITKDLFKNPKTFASALISGCKNFSKGERTENNKIFASDWGLELTVIDDGSFDIIGVRSHYIDIVEENNGLNTFELQIESIIEELFEIGLIVNSSKDSKINLRIDINKSKWEDLKRKEKLYFRIDPDNIMLLER